jgi:predicted kinase
MVWFNWWNTYLINWNYFNSQTRVINVWLIKFFGILLQMNQSFLIIISGPSCTGKTTLAKKISTKFSIPFITKDSLKESLFDDLSWNNREWSKKVGFASYNIIHYFLDSILSVGYPFIIESNFKPEFETKPILDLITKYHYRPIQVMCQCDGKILFDRFKKRAESGLRHPGHCDTTNYNEFKDLLLKGKSEPMDIGGEIVVFDSTDLNNLNYENVFDKIQQLTKFDNRPNHRVLTHN